MSGDKELEQPKTWRVRSDSESSTAVTCLFCQGLGRVPSLNGRDIWDLCYHCFGSGARK